MSRKGRFATGALLVSAGLAWMLFQQKEPAVLPVVVVPEKEIIPPGIVVTESASATPPPAGVSTAPGDRLLAGYGNPGLPPQNDVVLMARAISNFLIIDKQATARPLSANEEWSRALRGLRPGSEPWISIRSPAFDSNQRLIDRWGTPLIFHALGGKQWELRSVGPDRKPWTEDDLVEKFSG